MTVLDEYEMVMYIYNDIKNVIESIQPEDKSTYKAMYNNAIRIQGDLKKDYPQKALMVQKYLDFLNNLLENSNSKIGLGLVERGTNAGNQAEKLGTAMGFVIRCPECTFPTQRCRC